ncbi:MAG: hypothetical protein A2231_04925 [Candidatus Firestonebacteria bacterium RIFOXYA2_FULL_40_8]|nr:MAG: hypothetical protein A2231_04925 [Candidatus Firestonebacteria bacterium RIFOXYA2_FULL_40_8]
MKKEKKITRKELLEKAVRYTFAGILASVAGFLTIKSLFADKTCRDFDRCIACKDKSNCSLVTKTEITSKWKNK